MDSGLEISLLTYAFVCQVFEHASRCLKCSVLITRQGLYMPCINNVQACINILLMYGKSPSLARNFSCSPSPVNMSVNGNVQLTRVQRDTHTRELCVIQQRPPLCAKCIKSLFVSSLKVGWLFSSTPRLLSVFFSETVLHAAGLNSTIGAVTQISDPSFIKCGSTSDLPGHLDCGECHCTVSICV